MQAEKGALDEAERSLRYALRLSRATPSAAAFGDDLSRKGSRRGFTALSGCTERDSREICGLRRSGQRACAMRRFEERAIVSKAVAIDPKSADSHLSLGLVCADLDECGSTQGVRPRGRLASRPADVATSALSLARLSSTPRSKSWRIVPSWNVNSTKPWRSGRRSIGEMRSAMGSLRRSSLPTICSAADG